MAEVVTQRLIDDAGLADRVAVASTGTGDWHIGRPADAGSVRALAVRGYDGSRHRAQQLSAAGLADYDLLVGLDTANVSDIQDLLGRQVADDLPEVALLRDFAPGGAAGLGVPDPYGMSDDAFEHALDLVEQACRGLVEDLKKRWRPPA